MFNEQKRSLNFHIFKPFLFLQVDLSESNLIISEPQFNFTSIKVSKTFAIFASMQIKVVSTLELKYSLLPSVMTFLMATVAL